MYVHTIPVQHMFGGIWGVLIYDYEHTPFNIHKNAGVQHEYTRIIPRMVH